MISWEHEYLTDMREGHRNGEGKEVEISVEVRSVEVISVEMISVEMT